MLNEFDSNIALMKEMGERIKQIRIGREMTQKELSEKSGVSISTVTRIERGENVSVEQMLQVLRVLNLIKNLEYLIPETKKTPIQVLNGETSRKRVRRKKNKKDWEWGD